MKLAPHRIREAREAKELTYSELARRIAKRDEYLLGTTSGGQIRRWEEGRHRMRYESETIAAIAAETGREVSFFYETSDEQAASDDEEAAPVTVTFTVTGAPEDVVVALMARLQTPVGATR